MTKVTSKPQQKTLNASQVAAFYHDQFVSQQVEHFKSIALPFTDVSKTVVDIGGGCGYFAGALQRELGLQARVLDSDPMGIGKARDDGVDAVLCDALSPIKQHDEGVVCFNLILHHLVGKSEDETLALQKSAMTAWHSADIKIFVNEYTYESFFGNVSGWLIFQITKSTLLSRVGKAVSRLLPSLRANTFGVGVRFRSNHEWKSIFDECGFAVQREARGISEQVSLPRRFLLIRQIRRDSFFLSTK